MLFRAPDAGKPTVLLMIERNELEDQMLKNLERPGSIRRLNELLKNDYRCNIVTMIHKFRDMPAAGGRKDGASGLRDTAPGQGRPGDGLGQDVPATSHVDRWRDGEEFKGRVLEWARKLELVNE